MKSLAAVVLTLWAPFAHAEQRFGDWVTDQLGFEPLFSQSIGWDMPAATVMVTDPLAGVSTDATPIATPQTTAWLVGMFENEEDSVLAGMALVWSDWPYDRVERLAPPISQSGSVAFQTNQDLRPDLLAETVGAQLVRYTPGPFLAQIPDGTVFPVGESGRPNQCFQFHALYNNNDDLMALVVLFQSHLRDDADATKCAPLTS